VTANVALSLMSADLALEKVMPETHSHKHSRSQLAEKLTNIGDIYDQAGDAYIQYADGDPTQLFAFEGLHAYADRYVWSVLSDTLLQRRASGATSLRLLDAGCGPGTWLRRVITLASALGFTSISARGFDVSSAQIRRARALARGLSALPGVCLVFETADLCDPLPEPDASIDLTLCLYSVLSHLPAPSHAGVARELSRITAGRLVATVRPVGSTPTIFIDSLQKARQFQRDDREDRCEIELHDGRRIAAPFHLFDVAELRRQFGAHLDIEVIRGLDLFHGRFMPDPRWNPASMLEDLSLKDDLVYLEEAYATNPAFMERADHLLLVAHGRENRTSAPGAAVVR
jgi:SAM-dependent methyltransferase